MRRPNWTSLAAVAIMASSLTFAVILNRATEDPAPGFGSVPDFELVERGGRTVTRADFDGRVWVADFIFTRCAGTCPMMTYQMGQLNDALPGEVGLVSFTVDPAHDTPETLTRYAVQHDVEGDRWLFLTGARDALYRLAREGFHLAVDDTVGTAWEPITHSSRFALIDADGVIRNYYDGTSLETVARIVADVDALLAE